MSIVAILSSPRKGANCDTIVNAIADSAKANGKDVKFFDLCKMENKNGCKSCFGCKKNGNCVQKDDIRELLEAIKSAEGVIVSAPVYFGQPCAQYRIFEDRMFSFLDPAFNLFIDKGKKVAVVTAAGSAGAQELADQIEGRFVNYFKFEPVGKIAVVTGNAPDCAAKNADVLKAAAEIGKKF